jgi:rhamnosyltransferase
MPEAQRVAVVVTTYDPPAELGRLLEVLQQWTGPLLVIDDGSPQPVAPEVGEWIPLPRNAGVATALNRGLLRARELGATHVVTFDQDSLVGADYLPRLVRAWDEASRAGLQPGVVGPRDPGEVRYRGRVHGGYLVTTEVIQSAAMFDLRQLAEIGDFREELVIDGVDTEACLRLGERGFDVLCVELPMAHRLGRARPVPIIGRRVLVTGHPPVRQYYIMRNRLALVREHARRRPGWALATMRKSAVGAAGAVMAGPDRYSTARAVLRGVGDGLRGRLGQ